MGRKRRHEEVEQIVVSSDEGESYDENDRQQSEKKRHHRSKKSKKEKRYHRSRNKHSKKHRHKSGSETPEDEETSPKPLKEIDSSHIDGDETLDDDASTDREGKNLMKLGGIIKLASLTLVTMGEGLSSNFPKLVMN